MHRPRDREIIFFLASSHAERSEQAPTRFARESTSPPSRGLPGAFPSDQKMSQVYSSPALRGNVSMAKSTTPWGPWRFRTRKQAILEVWIGDLTVKPVSSISDAKAGPRHSGKLVRSIRLKSGRVAQGRPRALGSFVAALASCRRALFHCATPHKSLVPVRVIQMFLFPPLQGSLLLSQHMTHGLTSINCNTYKWRN